MAKEKYWNLGEVILYPPVWHYFLDIIQLKTERSAFFIHKNVPHITKWSLSMGQ